MLSATEVQKLRTACLKLPTTTVQEEEAYVTQNPVLILVSTVLSLNRRWYHQALPARKYFEQNAYPSLAPKTLEGLRTFIDNFKSNWLLLAETIWNNREQNKARMLS